MHGIARFVTILLLMFSITLVLLTLLDVHSLESYFIFALLELVLLRELVDPVEVRPDWQRQIDWWLTFGIIVFLAIIGRRIMLFIPSDAF
jgi:hypothetical protein